MFTIVTIHNNGNQKQLKTDDAKEAIDFYKNFLVGFPTMSHEEIAAMEIVAIALLNFGKVEHMVWL